MNENPFIRGWELYYDVLWRYWYIVAVMAVIAVWLRIRRTRRNAHKEQQSGIDRFEYDGENFHVVIENGKLTFTDKETGKVYERH